MKQKCDRSLEKQGAKALGPGKYTARQRQDPLGEKQTLKVNRNSVNRAGGAKIQFQGEDEVKEEEHHKSKICELEEAIKGRKLETYKIFEKE